MKRFLYYFVLLVFLVEMIISPFLAVAKAQTNYSVQFKVIPQEDLTLKTTIPVLQIGPGTLPPNTSAAALKIRITITGPYYVGRGNYWESAYPTTQQNLPQILIKCGGTSVIDQAYCGTYNFKVETLQGGNVIGTVTQALNLQAKTTLPAPLTTLIASPASLDVKIGETKKVKISGGSKPYKLIPISDPTKASATLAGDTVSVKGIADSQVFFKVEDSALTNKSSVQVNVKIGTGGTAQEPAKPTLDSTIGTKHDVFDCSPFKVGVFQAPLCYIIVLFINSLLDISDQVLEWLKEQEGVSFWPDPLYRIT